MRHRKSSGRVLSDIKDWIVSYLVVLIIPILICSVFFIYAYLIIWEETNDSNKVALQIVASELDDIFERTFMIEYEIQKSADIQAATQIRQPLNNEKHYMLVMAAQALNDCIEGETTIIDSCQVVYPNCEIVLMPGGVYCDMPACYSRAWESTNYTFNEWQDLVKQRHKRKFLSTGDTGTLGYIISLPQSKKPLKMNVIITLNKGYLQEILGKLDGVENSAVMLADVENNILIGRNLYELNIDKLSKEIKSNEGYERTTIDGKDMMVSCVKLENVNLRLISIIPYSEFWKTAIESLNYFWIALIMCIAVGFSVSYLFSVLKQRTWGKFDVLLKGKVDSKDNSLLSRNKEISEAIDIIVDEYDAMQNQIVSVNKMKRELLVASALRGRIRAEEVDSVFEKNNVDLSVGNYVVVLFKLNGFERFFDVEGQKVSEQDIVLIKQAIVSIIQELSQKEFYCEILSIDEKIVSIVDFGTLPKEECQEQIVQLVYRSREMAYERLSVLMTISISDVHKYKFSLNNAYSEAFRVMEYQISTGDELVMNYVDMVQKTQKSYLYSLENESALIHWIYEGKEKEALQLLDQICEKNIVYVNGSEELSKCLMWNLAASVLRAETELCDKIAHIDMQHLLSYVSTENNLFEAKQVLSERIKVLCAEVNMKKGKKGAVIAEGIKKFVDECYADPNLSNSEVALHFNLHVNYVTTLFREQTGISLLTYIQKVRLEKAKELLETTDLTLEEIGIRIGCVNGVSVVRLFKKYENITPTAYRKSFERTNKCK